MTAIAPATPASAAASAVAPRYRGYTADMALRIYRPRAASVGGRRAVSRRRLCRRESRRDRSTGGGDGRASRRYRRHAGVHACERASFPCRRRRCLRRDHVGGRERAPGALGRQAPGRCGCRGRGQPRGRRRDDGTRSRRTGARRPSTHRADARPDAHLAVDATHRGGRRRARSANAMQLRRVPAERRRTAAPVCAHRRRAPASRDSRRR